MTPTLGECLDATSLATDGALTRRAMLRETRLTKAQTRGMRIFVLLARQVAKAKVTEIGAYSIRDHTTITHHEMQALDQLARDPSFSEAYNSARLRIHPVRFYRHGSLT